MVGPSDRNVSLSGHATPKLLRLKPVCRREVIRHYQKVFALSDRRACWPKPRASGQQEIAAVDFRKIHVSQDDHVRIAVFEADVLAPLERLDIREPRNVGK